MSKKTKASELSEGTIPKDFIDEIETANKDVDNSDAIAIDNAEQFLNDMDDWKFDIKESSIKRALDAGVIYPNLKCYANTVYRIRMTSLPIKVITDKGEFWKISLKRDGMNYQLPLNNSFRFQLALLMERERLTSEQLLAKDLLIAKDDKGYFSIQLA